MACQAHFLGYTKAHLSSTYWAMNEKIPADREFFEGSYKNVGR